MRTPISRVRWLTEYEMTDPDDEDGTRRQGGIAPQGSHGMAEVAHDCSDGNAVR
jgi:hypothetical protein